MSARKWRVTVQALERSRHTVVVEAEDQAQASAKALEEASLAWPEWNGEVELDDDPEVASIEEAD